MILFFLFTLKNAWLLRVWFWFRKRTDLVKYKPRRTKQKIRIWMCRRQSHNFDQFIIQHLWARYFVFANPFGYSSFHFICLTWLLVATGLNTAYEEFVMRVKSHEHMIRPYLAEPEDGTRYLSDGSDINHKAEGPNDMG